MDGFQVFQQVLHIFYTLPRILGSDKIVGEQLYLPQLNLNIDFINGYSCIKYAQPTNPCFLNSHWISQQIELNYRYSSYCLTNDNVV